MDPCKSKLRREQYINSSGKLYNQGLIKALKNRNYFVFDDRLSGDAPKYLIKIYFYEANSGIKRRTNLRTWTKYIAKTAEKWYPHESVTEYFINRIGKVLGLNMNDFEIFRINGQIRFLSKFFHSDHEKLIHGAEIFGDYLNDEKFAKDIAEDKSSARKLFTFEFIQEAIKRVFPKEADYILKEFVKMLTFDAIVGNKDRHFYNWGVIGHVKKSEKQLRFAPIFDSARGLFWNYSDANLVDIYEKQLHGAIKVEKYVRNSLPRVSTESNKGANHFELIDEVTNFNQGYKEITQELISEGNERKVIKLLYSEFQPLVIKERTFLIEKVLKERFKRLREVSYDAED